MNSISVEAVLKKYWGYSEFRPLQREAVKSALNQKDSLVVMPTGGGKSLCYQLPAACKTGLVLVISPLIALMDDQVAAANELGLKAGALHSQTPAATRRQVFTLLQRQELNLLYVSPERLIGSEIAETVREQLALFAVDEAHCVSHWGHEFRPEYRQLGGFFANFSNVPRMALTATATPQVQKDICAQLGLRQPNKLIGHPDRPNLVYRSFPRHDQSYQVLEVIRRHKGEGGIVYAQTRKEVDRLAKTLAKAGVSCAPYHAGLSAEVRARAQDDFVHERLDVIVATIAFGMGIDRSNVRYVVHANTPRSIEHYQQESGRAGRDGEPAECVLLFSAGDLVMHRILSLRDDTLSGGRRQVIEKQLSEIGRFAIAPLCRHKLLSEHFGQVYPREPNQPPEDGCRACDVCLGETRELPGEEANLKAKMIISAVYRTENRFGAGYVTKVLLGKEDDRIIGNNHHNLRVFGMMKDSSERAIRAWIDQLVVQGHLTVSDGEYPVLRHTSLGLATCKNEAPVRLGHPVIQLKKRKTKKAALPAGLGEGETPIFEQLRKLRLLLARKLGLPPYMIFADSVLTSLAVLKPDSLEQLRGIKGIGDHKLQRYGQPFLAVLAGEDAESVAAAFS